jgi:flagellar basal-body rod modification protein FlgD
MFLQLLVAQLQNQDPTAPLDPSQFVGQLAQFSELSEVTSIYQLLQQEAPATTGSGSGSTGTGSGGGTPPATGNAIAAMGSVPASASAILPGIASAPAGVSNFSSPNLSALTSQIQGVF